MVGKPGPIDNATINRVPKKTRCRVSGLHPGRDSADLDESEPEKSQGTDALPILVEPGRQSDPVGECQTHVLTRFFADLTICREHSRQAIAAGKSSEANSVRGLGRQEKQEGATRSVEHGVVDL